MAFDQYFEFKLKESVSIDIQIANSRIENFITGKIIACKLRQNTRQLLRVYNEKGILPIYTCSFCKEYKEVDYVLKKY